MRFFFDENLPPTLPEALQILHKTSPQDKVEVSFIPDFLYRGVPDEEWIPAITEASSATVVTCDYKLHKRRDQRLLYQENGLGLVVLRPNSKKGMAYWKQVQYIIRYWKKILEIERETPKPYLFLLKISGKPELLYNGKNWQDK